MSVLADWRKFEKNLFDKEHPDIGNWKFKKVYEERPKFVQFSLIWLSATGVYGNFKKYCEARINYETSQSATRKLSVAP